eukprot:TRINITY_DN21550_c0_g1_i1.p1 TRINITY_DN21550_c0_g1~~TRINITY_DN21550_c0_g1_i1.p1  ORF type:complete len:438 (+),score=75.32 TRINITY_DN21550_c0_g1_i1:56-1369(+)
MSASKRKRQSGNLNITPMTTQDNKSLVNEDIISLIASLLDDPADIINLISCCKDWMNYRHSEKIWRIILQMTYPGEPLLELLHPESQFRERSRQMRNWNSNRFVVTNKTLGIQSRVSFSLDLSEILVSQSGRIHNVYDTKTLEIRPLVVNAGASMERAIALHENRWFASVPSVGGGLEGEGRVCSSKAGTATQGGDDLIYDPALAAYDLAMRRVLILTSQHMDGNHCQVDVYQLDGPSLLLEKQISIDTKGYPSSICANSGIIVVAVPQCILAFNFDGDRLLGIPIDTTCKIAIGDLYIVWLDAVVPANPRQNVTFRLRWIETKHIQNRKQEPEIFSFEWEGTRRCAPSHVKRSTFVFQGRNLLRLGKTLEKFRFPVDSKSGKMERTELIAPGVDWMHKSLAVDQSRIMLLSKAGALLTLDFDVPESTISVSPLKCH